MTFRRNRRRALAMMLALAWLLGIETLPALHLAAHDDDHTHAPDGTIVRVTFGGGHRHADGSVHGAHVENVEISTPAPRRRFEQLAFRTSNDHAASGIAHHAAALQLPPPPMLATAFERLARDVSRFFVEQLQAVAVARPNARGPPLA